MTTYKKILIVEDELVIAENTKSMILNLFEGVEVEIAGNSAEARELIWRGHPDLAFVDIRLGKRDSGIDLSRELEGLKIPFIFLTAHGDEATISKAVQSNPLGYLVKPVSRQDLLVNLKLALQKIATEHFYIFRDGSHDVRLPENTIVYLQVEGNYTEIHTTEKRYVERKSMTKILEELEVQLIRIHRKCYVNTVYIKEANASVYLTTGKVLPISRNYKKALQEQLFSK